MKQWWSSGRFNDKVVVRTNGEVVIITSGEVVIRSKDELTNGETRVLVTLQNEGGPTLASKAARMVDTQMVTAAIVCQAFIHICTANYGILFLVHSL